MKDLKVIVAGSRDFSNYLKFKELLMEALESLPQDKPISLVSGMARGPDMLAVRFAREYNVMLYEFPADWDKYGKRAGYIRNNEMRDFADVLIAFWDEKSRGTLHMINAMEKASKQAIVVTV